MLESNVSFLGSFGGCGRVARCGKNGVPIPGFSWRCATLIKRTNDPSTCLSYTFMVEIISNISSSDCRLKRSMTCPRRCAICALILANCSSLLTSWMPTSFLAPPLALLLGSAIGIMLGERTSSVLWAPLLQMCQNDFVRCSPKIRIMSIATNTLAITITAASCETVSSFLGASGIADNENMMMRVVSASSKRLFFGAIHGW
mmetsp:Transcript_38068/g.104768  ORF Transcript_38068/g.104768 Transcript_38068/m.104768 type:complete len:202 (-) Transcript_38068:3265-3870(-)